MPTRRLVVCSKHEKRRETISYSQDYDVAVLSMVVLQATTQSKFLG
jgi:hypothetical protein